MVVNRQSDTHAVGIYGTPLKGVRDGVVSHRHTNGNGIYLPAASTSAKLLTAILEVEVPESQKQSVSDAFHNVVLPPYYHSDIPRMLAWRELAGAKV